MGWWEGQEGKEVLSRSPLAISLTRGRVAVDGIQVTLTSTLPLSQGVSAGHHPKQPGGRGRLPLH